MPCTHTSTFISGTEDVSLLYSYGNNDGDDGDVLFWTDFQVCTQLTPEKQMYTVVWEIWLERFKNFHSGCDHLRHMCKSAHAQQHRK